MQNKIDTLWRTYAATNDWIKFVDAKAGFLITANGVLITIFLSEVLQITNMAFKTWYFGVLLLLCITLMVVSIIFSILCLNPVLVKEQPESLIFFCHIAEKYKTAEEFKETIDNQYSDEGQIFTQVSNQVWALSNVATYKLKMIKQGINFFIAAILIGVLGLLIFFFQAFINTV